MKKIRLPIVLSATLLAAIVGGMSYFFFIHEDTSKTCTTYDGQRQEQCIEDYIGLTQEDAIARAEKYGYLPKVASVDGQGKAVTDENGLRIFLVIEKGVVVNAYFEDGKSQS